MLYRPLVFAIALAAVGSAGLALAQTASPPPFQGPVLAQDRVLSRAIGSIEVSSSAFVAGAAIPIVHSGYGKSVSFPLSWTPGPRGTRAYAVIVEDPDSHMPQPTLHWLVYNIPGEVTALGKSIHTKAEITGGKPLMQGRNSKGGIGYVGPHPAVGDPPHHYHVQVFALSRMLPLGGGATLDQVVTTMTDRVLAEGELIGSFQAPDPSAPSESRKAKP
jgi:Raf kinase inhibitor-like YbhB/YbcL family protein